MRDSVHTSAWRKLLPFFAALALAFGLSLAVTAAGSPAYAADENPAGLTAVEGGVAIQADDGNDSEADAPISIATEALPNGIVGEDYEFQLEAAGAGSDSVTWSKERGSANYVTVSESGLVTIPARSSWSSGININVKVTNADEQSAEKQFTIKILYKYKQFTGSAKDDTVYVSISKDGEFVTSDGETAGMLMDYVPAKLADVAKMDLDAYGLSNYKLASDGTGNYAYEVTYLQAMLYALDNYAAPKAAGGFALGDWSSPGSLWIDKFWDVESPYLTYGRNGAVLLNEDGTMPTADTVALVKDDDLAINFYTDSSWYGDSNSGDHYFIDGDAVQHAAEAFTGVETSFNLTKVTSSTMDYTSYTSNREPEPGYPIGWGKVYGVSEGAADLATDENGSVKITFPEAGTYFVWANGIKGADSGTSEWSGEPFDNTDKVVSAPAMVTVTVTDLAAPSITTESLPSAAQNAAYEAQLEAEGNPAEFAWALAEGSSLPEGLELSEDGVISGKPAAVGTTTFSVTCSNGVEPVATKEISLAVLKKYRELTGTAYMSISADGEFAVSDGTVAKEVMWRVPVDLAEASAYDLDEHGLGKYNMAAVGEGADYAYEATILQVMAYVSDKYSASPMDVSGAATTMFFKSYFGHNQNLNYYVNGVYPLYEGTTTGATADAIAVADGDDIHVILQPEDDDYGMFLFDPAFGIHYFWDANDEPTFAYEGVIGENVQVKLGRSGLDSLDYGTPKYAESGYEISYGRAYGKAEGTVTTDKSGGALIEFPSDGVWYLWAKGSPAEEYAWMIGDGCISSAAMAKVKIFANKYKQFTGDSADDMVYLSVSKEGEFVTSDGETSGTLLNYVPVKLADLAKVDLDSYGLGDYKLASDGTGDYAYEISYLQAMIYAHETYYSGKAEDGFAIGAWSAPRSLWISKFWGVGDAYFTYGLNGNILIDEAGQMPTADTVALANGDDLAMNFYTDASWYGDSNTADHYFLDGEAVQHEAETLADVDTNFNLVKVYSSVMDYTTYAMKSSREPAADYPISWGKVYGVAEGEGATDAEGVVTVTFPEAGTWYVWANGVKGAEHPDKVVSAPAMVTVTVTAADEAPFNEAKADAEAKAKEAQDALTEANKAADEAKAAADAVNAASDPTAKAEAAAAAANAAQVAVQKAEAAAAAAEKAAEAAQALQDLALTNSQKKAASDLVAQVGETKAQADAAKTSADAAKTAADEAKKKADADKAAADKKAQETKVEAGKTYQVGGMSYQVTKVASGSAEGAVALTQAKDAASVAVPDTVKLADGKTYKVDTIKTKAFSNLKKLKKATVGANIKKIEKSAFFKTPKLKKLVVKSKLLKKKSSVKGALKGSKAKKLTVKVPKKLKKAYKKSFSKKNLKAPKKVTVK